MLLGQTAMANLVSILKSRDTTLPIPLCKKPMVFPVAIYMAMWELDHKKRWALKNWLFQIVVLGKTLESPLESKEINPSFLKEISPEYSLEGLMLKLKLQYFGHFMQIDDSLEKSLMLGNIEGRRKKGYQRMRWLDGITSGMAMKLGKV